MVGYESRIDEILTLPSPGVVSWAAFDSEWYLSAYSAVREAVDGSNPTSVLRFYIRFGQGLGHSPNIYFDEAWHRNRYPHVAEAVLQGRAASAFDAYCREGFHGRSPHWLFDEIFYRAQYPDLTEGELAARGVVNGYDHYLRYGDLAGRSGHPLFDPATYRADLDPEERARAEENGCFTHYLRSLALRQRERRPSIFFEPEWYAAEWHLDQALTGAGSWLSALHHYLCNDTPTLFDPLPEFSERHYLDQYYDVAEAVRAGRYRNGYEHFLAKGRRELRSPRQGIDLKYYSKRLEVPEGDAFTHYLLHGRGSHLYAVPAEPPDEAEAAAQLSFRQRAENLLPLYGRQKFDFTCSDRPELSVIMVLHNQFALTLAALASLRANFAGSIELMLVDLGSTDETSRIDQYVSGADIYHFDANVGFIRGCNVGVLGASAEFILYLNNDIELAFGAVDAGLRHLRSKPGVGAVGGKIIRSHGLLQEAGCIVWRNGTTTGYLRGQSPLVPEANFVRTVDYCSAVFLMVRTDVVEQLGGFDDDLMPAYYEDADLCIRIRQAGYDVVYDPSIVVLHFEHGSTESGVATAADMIQNRDRFFKKHADYLQGRPIRNARLQHSSPRFAAGDAKRILLIEDTVPLRFMGSGYVRSNDIIQVMASLGYQVTVFPMQRSQFDIASIYRDMPDTVEVMYDKGVDSLPEFLVERRDHYDAVWVARTHNLSRIRHLLDSLLVPGPGFPLIVLDTEAIVAKRDAANTAVTGGETRDLASAVEHELRHADICRTIVTASEEEVSDLRRLGWDNVSVIGHMRRPMPTPRAFADRAGILFVGAMHKQLSPDYDSLVWFVDEVLPIIEQSLQWQTRLTVVGYTAPGVSLERFANHSRVTLRGMIADTEPLYDQHRVFVAPTRFAAGLPYKIYEAASYGLPVVATELLSRQMNWQNGIDLLSADAQDPELMAKHVIALYEDEALWQQIRVNALERLRRENSYAEYVKAIERVLGPANGHLRTA